MERYTNLCTFSQGTDLHSWGQEEEELLRSNRGPDRISTAPAFLVAFKLVHFSFYVYFMGHATIFLVPWPLRPTRHAPHVKSALQV